MKSGDPQRDLQVALPPSQHLHELELLLQVLTAAAINTPNSCIRLSETQSPLQQPARICARLHDAIAGRGDSYDDAAPGPSPVLPQYAVLDPVGGNSRAGP